MARTMALPPGPRLPGWLQTLAFAVASERFIDACSRRYGDVVTFNRLVGPRFVMVFDANLAKQLLHAPPDQLRGGETNTSLRPVVGEHSLLLLDGPEHTGQRKLLLPSFQGDGNRSYAAATREAADTMIDSWPVGEPFALLPSLGSLTLNVIIHAVFGPDGTRPDREFERRIREMIDPVLPRLGALALALPGRIGNPARERLSRRRLLADKLIYEAIARRRAAPELEERHDVLSRLLLTRDEHGEEMDDVQVRDQLVTILLAGYGSTQAALAWAFDLLLRNPRVLERLRGRLAAGDGSYLDAVVSETLRMRPVAVSISRMVGEALYELDGHAIPPGTEINVSILELHRQEDCFPEPQAFRPERFLDADSDTNSWVPFGTGGRRCLGASFAPFEMGIVIRRVLERTQLVPVGRRPEKRSRFEMTLRNGTTFLPKRGVRVIQERAPAPAVGAEHSPETARTLQR